MEAKRFGRQTPTVGFTLPYRDSLGDEAIALYEKSGRIAMDWQRSLINDILAINDDGLWVHTRFGFSLPRQNGKNEVVAIREIRGLFSGERILHTAHRTATSRAAWERDVKIIESMGIHEIKGKIRSGYTSGKSKGQEWIEFDEAHGGGLIAFRTRSTTGGLGETYDVLVIDEAQEYQDEQESALKYTIVSSDNPQTIFLGTPPTPYSSGTIFPHLRQDILTGKKSNAGWAEWSIEDRTDVRNKDAWYQTNPSLGYKLTERAIYDEIGQDDDDFNIQRLGLWISYNQKSAISRIQWDACKVERFSIKGPITIGIKFSKDGGSVSLSVAGKQEDGSTFAECYACRSMRDGIGWIVSFLRGIDGQYTKVCVDGASGIEMLTKAMTEAGLKKPYEVTVKEVIAAYSAFEAGINSRTLLHMEQPSVTQVVTNVEKRAIGSSGGFGFKATNLSYDISILDSIALAAWGAETFKAKKKQKISY